jgi:methionine biosynthesis protein MetW
VTLSPIHALIAGRIPAGSDVLHVGCGSGELALALESTRGCRTLGIEVDADSAGAALEHGLEVVTADLEAQSVGEVVEGRRFDAVVITEALPHVRDPGRLLLQAARVLHPEGFILASFPNVSHVDIQARLAEDDWLDMPPGPAAHRQVSFFTLKTFSDLTFRTGLDLVETWRLADPEPEVWPSSQTVAHLLDESQLRSMVEANRVNPGAYVREYLVELRPAGRPALAQPVSGGHSATGSSAPGHRQLDVIVVTDGKHPQLLKEALYSCASISDAQVRALVVLRDGDPGRRDELAQLLRRYDGLLPISLEVVPREVGTALNRGLLMAEGEYAAFIRDSDVLYPTFAQRLLAALEEDGALWLAFGRSQVMAGDLTDSGFTSREKGPELGAPLDKMRLLVEDYIPLHACAVRASALRAHGVRFSEREGVEAGWAFLCHLAALGELQHVPEVIAETHVTSSQAPATSETKGVSAARSRRAILDELGGQPVRMTVGELAAIADQLALARDDLRGERLRSQLMVDRLLQSRSWKLTRPLRRLVRSDLPDL